MNSNKNIKSLIRKYLLEQETTYGPPNWFRVPPNTVQDTTKYEYSPDGKWYKQKNATTPELDIQVTKEVFQGIESILGKVAKKVEGTITYIPNQIMQQYQKALSKTKYLYKDENGDVSEYSYEGMGNQISTGKVKLNTQVKRLIYNTTTDRREPSTTKKASEYPELKEFFWGDESQKEIETIKKNQTEAEKTRQLEILRGYVNKGVFGKDGVDFEEITITTLPGYYIGIKLLNPREGKTVVLLYDNKISIMNPNNTLSSPTPNIENNGATETSGIIKRQGDPYEYKVESDNWLAKKTGTQKWFNITGVDFKPAYQQSIDILDTENPKSRTANAPKRTK